MNMNSTSVTKARANLYGLIEEVKASNKPLLITGKRGNAILLSEENWHSIQETLYLLSIPGMRESIREGLATPIQELDSDIEW